MNKVLLIGGAGYVGCVLVEELLERGYAVRVLDRMYFGDDGLKPFRDRVEVVVSDMRDVASQVLEGVDSVINVGGLSNDPTAEYNPQANHEMNTVAAVTLANACREAGIKRYIYASSCSIYDQGVKEEELDVIQDETSAVNPHAAYSGSKRAAELELLPMATDNFCPVVLRKGTIFGFSPRMRYDLVVNTFVKSVLSTGKLTIHYGGEMWRPLVEVRDAARAYIMAMEAPVEKVRGEIFNVSMRNFRISELALRVRKTLRDLGVPAEIELEYGYKGVRSYRVSTKKIEDRLGWRAQVGVEESVRHIVEKVRAYGYEDYDNPRYYNIRWMKLLEEAARITGPSGSVFGMGA